MTKAKPTNGKAKGRDNTQVSRGPGGKWEKGTASPNPKGSPKRGESWQELIKRVGEYTPAEAAERSLELAKQLLKIGNGVTLKEAVVLRVYGALLFEPQGSLLNAFMDRAEGKVSQPVELTVYDSLAAKLGVTPDQARIISERFAKGELTIGDVLTGKASVDASTHAD